MIDLHSHTHFSDGALAPVDLITRASALGVEYLAITDHDSVTAFQSLSERERRQGNAHNAQPTAHDEATTAIPPLLAVTGLSGGLISGLEVSCQWEGLEIHILGLFVDVCHPTLTQLLAKQQDRRRQRAAAIDGAAR